MQTILSTEHYYLTIKRLAHQLVEDLRQGENPVYIGLQPRGIFVAADIMDEVRKINNAELKFGKLDITFYRDDVRKELHKANDTDIPFAIDNKDVVLIDDVLFTGRTIRAALDALMDFGRPKSVKLCVLVNRFHNRELPIQPDFEGIVINTKPEQKVKVMQDERNVTVY